jgi:hypothetical protein
MAIQQIILHTIGKGLQTAATGAVVAQMAVIGSAAAGPAALVSLATAGGNAIPAQAGIASTVGLATVLGAPKARGGRIFGPGSDTSDGILTPTSRDEFVIKAPSARRIGYANLEEMNATGELPSLASTRAIRPMNVAAAQPKTSIGLSSDDRAFLAAEMSRAIAAQPGISLYASLDPAEMLQRALGAPAGQRALLAHLGENSASVKATLNR